MHSDSSTLCWIPFNTECLLVWLLFVHIIPLNIIHIILDLADKQTQCALHGVCHGGARKLTQVLVLHFCVA